MACGEFAEPIYKLINDLGDSEEARELVFDNLVKYLSGIEIERFVESFRQDYDITSNLEENHFGPEVDAPTEDMEFETNDYDICLSCQATFHEDDTHVCDDEATFFSSRIPSC